MVLFNRVQRSLHYLLSGLCGSATPLHSCFSSVVLLLSVHLLSAGDDCLFQISVFLLYSLAHSSQWFRYSAKSLSLKVAEQRGHSSSDGSEHLFQARPGEDAAAAAGAAAGCCCVSALTLSRGSEESLCRLDEIRCPMCTRHMGSPSLLSLLAPCRNDAHQLLGIV